MCIYTFHIPYMEYRTEVKRFGGRGFSMQNFMIQEQQPWLAKIRLPFWYWVKIGRAISIFHLIYREVEEDDECEGIGRRWRRVYGKFVERSRRHIKDNKAYLPLLSSGTSLTAYFRISALHTKMIIMIYHNPSQMWDEFIKSRFYQLICSKPWQEF